jgi:hypothetical protein
MAIGFLREQPYQAHEFALSIDPHLISKMNKWRLAQVPVQTPDEAIISLIRLGLSVPQWADMETGKDAQIAMLVAQFRSFLTRTQE